MLKTNLLFLLGCFWVLFATAQATFPVNGIANPQSGSYAFTGATIYKNANEVVEEGIMLIRDKQIVAAGKGIKIPADAVVIDCRGKFIYPAFVDAYGNYGIETPARTGGGSFGSQLAASTTGPVAWNDALKPQVNAAMLFHSNEKQAENLRKAGFGTVLTHQRDGIARGTGVLVSLASLPDQLVVLKEKASAQYSFNKGTSTQSYPSSLMGVIALIRQTYLDADWYKGRPVEEGTNVSLEAWNLNQNLPQIFEANDKWAALRADRIGKEFGKKYIIKAGGNEYQRIAEMKKTGFDFILPLDFPLAMDVEDANDARYVSLGDMKHWEMAPLNPRVFEQNGIRFALTYDGLKDSRSFWTNLRKAVAAGLSEKSALSALTSSPAQMLGVYDLVGSLEPGKVASFLIVSKPLFEEGSVVLQNWIQGEKYAIEEKSWESPAAVYALKITRENGQTQNYTLDVSSGSAAKVVAQDTLNARFSNNGKLVKLVFPGKKGGSAAWHLSGVDNGSMWQGTGTDTLGNHVIWTATLQKQTAAKDKPSAKKTDSIALAVTYPFGAYGWSEMPVARDVLIRNGTVWTSDEAGVMPNTDVLLRNGKIAAIGKNLSAGKAQIIDATGKHVTPGIIDEHTHIATFSVNEGGQSVTSEVRIGDNVNPDDINIYRQLSGGVTTAQILHGSANTIGGQSQLIKLRWGADAEGLKFEDAPPFIKFALGENVKRTTSRSNNRFPNTRMGVYEVLMDAFTRAKDYEKALAAYENRGKKNLPPVRRDLELDALVEILNGKRFITSHSYVQSEITSAMRVAEQFSFKYNTFTHILEGYKVADKMKEHGVSASTFSDWFGYKMEVIDAIPQNAAIMHKVGLNVAINSDDAEMARRLNQEAAKSIQYGLSEEEALKLVTINPATMLRIAERTGSLRAGKDADVVIWSDNPLSIYAKAEKTFVDGIPYFDRERDLALRAKIQSERNRLIQKMNGEKKAGKPVTDAKPSLDIVHDCGHD